jgi:glycosyltransferase involved in cell wall biosynthesis
MPSTSISIVVPSLNDAGRLSATLESLAAQDYPPLDVIIEERGSTDPSLAIAADFVRRFPRTFRLFAGADSGEADALNRGFARANGEILGYLVPGDTLLPGILDRVAKQIDPGRDRFVVMGRCYFSGESLRNGRVEFPARYVGHFEYLAIWKRGFNEAPQPTVFWHRRAWERCGGFDVRLRHAFDYDLFCRFSRSYPFCPVDDFWGAICIDESLRPGQCSEAEVLELSIACSRRYWGSWLSPLRWRCETSYRLHSRQSHEHARHHARKAEAAVRSGRLLAAFGELMQTLRYSPSMAWKRLFSRWLATSKRLAFRLFSR